MWGYTPHEWNVVVECGLNVRMERDETERLNLFEMNENLLKKNDFNTKNAWNCCYCYQNRLFKLQI